MQKTPRISPVSANRTGTFSVNDITHSTSSNRPNVSVVSPDIALALVDTGWAPEKVQVRTAISEVVPTLRQRVERVESNGETILDPSPED
jgi:hypothetical protein